MIHELKKLETPALDNEFAKDVDDSLSKAGVSNFFNSWIVTAKTASWVKEIGIINILSKFVI